MNSDEYYKEVCEGVLLLGVVYQFLGTQWLLYMLSDVDHFNRTADDGVERFVDRWHQE